MAQVNAKRLIVLGGGLSGLTYVHYLRNFLEAQNKAHLIQKIILLEGSDYVGGSVKTNVFDDGMVHEQGPRSIRYAGVKAKNTVVLIDQLGLGKQIVPLSNIGGQRFLYHNGEMRTFNMNLGSLFKKIPFTNQRLGPVVIKEMLKSSMNLEELPGRDPSIHQFFAHRFGNDVADKIIDPLMRGITAGDCRDLSMRAIFGDIIDREQAYGSVIKGFTKPPVTKMKHDDLFPHDMIDNKLLDRFDKEKISSYTLTTGLQSLPIRLSNSLLNTNEDEKLSIYSNTRAISMRFDPDVSSDAPCAVGVKTVDGETIELESDHIVASIPSSEMAKLLPNSAPEHNRLSTILDKVTQTKHVPVGCVTAEYRDLDRSNVHEVVNSFGFLANSKSEARVLGIAFDTSSFPQIDRPFNSFRLTVMMGGSWHKEVFGTSDMDQVSNSQLEQIALEEVARMLRIKQDPHRISTLLWKTGIANYSPGHMTRLEDCRKELAAESIPLTLLGQSYDGFSVNDVIFASRMAAYEMVKSL